MNKIRVCEMCIRDSSLPGGNACTELLGIGAGVLYLSGSQDGGADRTGAGKERE